MERIAYSSLTEIAAAERNLSIFEDGVVRRRTERETLQQRLHIHLIYICVHGNAIKLYAYVIRNEIGLAAFVRERHCGQIAGAGELIAAYGATLSHTCRPLHLHSLAAAYSGERFGLRACARTDGLCREAVYLADVYRGTVERYHHVVERDMAEEVGSLLHVGAVGCHVEAQRNGVLRFVLERHHDARLAQLLCQRAEQRQRVCRLEIGVERLLAAGLYVDCAVGRTLRQQREHLVHRLERTCAVRCGVESVVAARRPCVGRVDDYLLFGCDGLHYATRRETHGVSAGFGVAVHRVALGACSAVAEVPFECLCVFAAKIGELGAVHVCLYRELRLQIAFLGRAHHESSRTAGEADGSVGGSCACDVAELHRVHAVLQRFLRAHRYAHHYSVVFCYLRSALKAHAQHAVLLRRLNGVGVGAQRLLYIGDIHRQILRQMQLEAERLHVARVLHVYRQERCLAAIHRRSCGVEAVSLLSVGRRLAGRRRLELEVCHEMHILFAHRSVERAILSDYFGAAFARPALELIVACVVNSHAERAALRHRETIVLIEADKTCGVALEVDLMLRFRLVRLSRTARREAVVGGDGLVVLRNGIAYRAISRDNRSVACCPVDERIVAVSRRRVRVGYAHDILLHLARPYRRRVVGYGEAACLLILVVGGECLSAVQLAVSERTARTHHLAFSVGPVLEAPVGVSGYSLHAHIGVHSIQSASAHGGSLCGLGFQRQLVACSRFGRTVGVEVLSSRHHA